MNCGRIKGRRVLGRMIEEMSTGKGYGLLTLRWIGAGSSPGIESVREWEAPFAVQSPPPPTMISVAAVILIVVEIDRAARVSGSGERAPLGCGQHEPAT